MSGFKCPECGGRALTEEIHREFRPSDDPSEVRYVSVCHFCVNQFTTTESIDEYEAERGDDHEKLNSFLESLNYCLMWLITGLMLVILILGVYSIATIIGGAI